MPLVSENKHVKTCPPQPGRLSTPHNGSKSGTPSGKYVDWGSNADDNNFRAPLNADADKCQGCSEHVNEYIYIYTYIYIYIHIYIYTYIYIHIYIYIFI